MSEVFIVTNSSFQILPPTFVLYTVLRFQYDTVSPLKTGGFFFFFFLQFTNYNYIRIVKYVAIFNLTNI